MMPIAAFDVYATPLDYFAALIRYAFDYCLMLLLPVYAMLPLRP